MDNLTLPIYFRSGHVVFPVKRRHSIDTWHPANRRRLLLVRIEDDITVGRRWGR